MLEVVLAIYANGGGKDDGNYNAVGQKAGGNYIDVDHAVMIVVRMLIML